jgi:hypothetical protein
LSFQDKHPKHRSGSTGGPGVAGSAPSPGPACVFGGAFAHGNLIGALVVAFALASACAPRAQVPVERVSMPELDTAVASTPPSAEPEPIAEEQAEPEPEPPPALEGDRTTIEGTIEIGIQLLEQRRYVELIRELADPDDVARFDSDREIEQVAAELSGDKAQLLLEIFISLRGRAPEFSDDGTEATFDVSDFPDVPDDTLTMRRVGDRWYIAN